MLERKRKTAIQQVERRLYPRVPLVARVQCASLGREKTMVTRNVSLGGIFVITTNPLPPETEVALSFYLKESDATISCRGRVLYGARGLGMGIVFLDLANAGRRRLEKFVDEAV